MQSSSGCFAALIVLGDMNHTGTNSTLWTDAKMGAAKMFASWLFNCPKFLQGAPDYRHKLINNCQVLKLPHLILQILLQELLL